MDRLEELKQKYASVLDKIQKSNVRLDHLHVQDNKLFLQGAAPNEQLKNDVWNQIKAVDPACGDLTCDLSVDSSLTPPVTKYTVVAGDSLSKIAKHFYGDAQAYMKIFEANKGILKDPNMISVGQELVIPT